MSDEQAKAVQEVAKATSDIVKLAGGAGAYLAKIFGSILENVLGYYGGDWLQHKRLRHLAVLGAETQRVLESVDVKRITEPNPAVLIPLLQAAADEAESELQAMWAALLANAMLDGGGRVRRTYIEVLRTLDPADILVLKGMSDSWASYGDENSALTHEERISLEALFSRGCVHRIRVTEEWDKGLPLFDVPYSYKLSPLGEGLIAACATEVSYADVSITNSRDDKWVEYWARFFSGPPPSV
jgi:hypothetical protein